MPSQRINFTFSDYHLGKALQIVRQLDPSYKLTTFNALVKIIANDYLSKMNGNQANEVPSNIMDEIIKKKEEMGTQTKTQPQPLSIEALYHLKQPK